MIKKILLSATLVFALARISFAQQNFFNVPSSDITPKAKLFYQQQVNFSSKNLVSNTTLNMGLGHNYEIGLNINGILFEQYNHFSISDSLTPYTPFLCLNGQKRLDLHKHLSLAIGNQLGITPQNHHLADYTFINTVYTNEKYGLKIVPGLYYISDGFVGAETRNGIAKDTHSLASKIGLQAGVEKDIWKDRLFVQGDFISGQHALGEAVVGAAYFISKRWVISGGYQIPTFKSRSERSIVFEMTFVPGENKHS